MSIETSLKWVTDFWRDNQALVEDIQKQANGAPGQLKNLVQALDEKKSEATQLSAALGKPFDAGNAAVKAKQQDLIKQIAELDQEINQFRNTPAIVADLLTNRADLNEALSETFDATVQTFVQFTPNEITELNDLLTQASLDADSRLKWAKVLDAGVALTEMALKIAVKIAAA